MENLKHLYHIVSRNILKMEKVHSSTMVVPTYQKHDVIKENKKKKNCPLKPKLSAQ